MYIYAIRISHSKSDRVFLVFWNATANVVGHLQPATTGKMHAGLVHYVPRNALEREHAKITFSSAARQNTT